MNEWGAAVVAFFGGGGVIVITVVWGLKNLDKVERIAGLLFRALNWVHGRWVYRNIATNIQSKVNQYGERLSRQVEGILPRAMKIEWTKDAKSAEASLRDGQVIVTIDASANRDRNLVVSTVAYLGKGLLPWARLYADANVMRATDFAIAKDIFVSSGEHSAVQYFFENFLKPEIEANPKLATDCQHIETMQEKGIFTRIFLRQLSVLGNKLYPAVPRESQKKETRDFKQFVYGIADKERGVDVPGGLTFSGASIRASVLLVARQETLMYRGLQPYLRRIRICRDRGIEYLYVCGMGTDNVLLAEYIAKEQEKAGTLTLVDAQKLRLTIDGRDTNSICIFCALGLTVPPRAKSESVELVHRVMEEYIEEVANGDVEVLALAREPGVKLKIAVQSLSASIDAVAVCRERGRLSAIRFALGGEEVEFLEWTTEPETMIIRSLAPLASDQITEVLVDEDENFALVKLESVSARRNALGMSDLNLRLAMELTGYTIAFEVE